MGQQAVASVGSGMNWRTKWSLKPGSALCHTGARQDGRTLEGFSILGPFFGISALPDIGGRFRSSPRACHKSYSY